MAALYARSHAIVHPTFYDPFPRVIVEAMASGCAVITTARCGAAEIVTNGREGLIVDDPRDVVSCGEAIAALADRSRLMAMRVAATRLAQQFDQDTHFADASAWLVGPKPA
jgi:UDP-glucose:(heptosyl)LPS alpha-1,3-glucosyltransferase